MKILFITTSFPRGENDIAGRFIADLADFLAGKGDHIEVVAPADDGKMRYDGVFPYEVHRFDYAYPRRLQNLAYGDGIPENITRSPLKALHIPFFLLAFLRKCLTYVGDFDIIHAHWMLPAGLIGIITKKISCSRLVITIHSADLNLLESLPCAGLLGRFFIHNADSLTVVSAHQKEALRRITGGAPELLSKVRVIPMGVQKAPPREPALSQKHERPVLLFMGRLVPVKGVRFLIEATSGLRGAMILIAGEGSEKKALLSEAGRLHVPVEFLGNLHGTEKIRIIDSADIVIFPSIVLENGRTDGLPVSLLEAMTRGKAIIASNVGGIPGVIRNGENGILVNPGDPGVLARAIGILCEDRAFRARLESAALRSSAEFLMERTGELYYELYRKITRSCDDGVKACGTSLV